MQLKPSQIKLRGGMGQSHQRGISLIESLVAIVVLALGIMGLAGVQTRMLAESRTANYRALAIGLIDDLNNRMLLNRTAALAGSYALAWGAAATAAQNCAANDCTATQLATSDLNQWRAAVAAALPGANTAVFLSPNDSRQVGIAIAWSSNEGKAADTDGDKYRSPFAVTAALSGVACPTGSICHFAYVQP